MLQLELVTPSGTIADTPVEELRLPGTLGEFGVLPGHRPMLAALRSGMFAFRCGTQETALAIGPGFSRIGAKDSVLVVTERALRAEQIDVEAAQHALAEGEAALRQWTAPLPNASEPGAAEYAELLDRVRWAEAQLAVAGLGGARR
ncbi:MAG: ATP synthase F1 subunit epsilon [Proteobacteria bacterium]|nr:ATP synthase F1 subunit epsilon [Pseudomonadota bacterium]